MNMLDRLVSWVNPAAGLSRVRARSAIKALDGATRAYDGARRGRGNGRAPATSANAEIGPASSELRNRARSLVRNNPHASRIVDVLAANLVGAGIMPVSKTGSRTIDRKVNDLWRRWSDQCDADGQLDFYGLQSLAVREIVEAGEVVARFRPRRTSDGLPVPLQIQLLEADHIDDARHQMPQDPNTLLGIEFDALGKRAAYWLFPEHPGEIRRLKSLESVRIDASDVLHVYRKQRAGQIRGVSTFAPIIMTARDIADYHQSSLVKARVEACFSGFVTNVEGDQPAIGRPGKDGDGQRLQSFEPGMITYLKAGEQITFAQPTSAPVFDPFMIHTLMAMAAGAGITYDQLTGDLRQANYSSLRAGKIEFRRLVEQIQYHNIIPMFCAPTWRRFIDFSVLSGALPQRRDGYPCDWITPANEPIDPVKDMTADILAVRSGRMTLRQFIAAWGIDPDAQIEEIAEINKLLDAQGIILDVDPRKTARAGTAQQTPDAGAN
ncbi:lambda family phage portal protein [Ancylobacter sp. 3268]|uniref:phage portal protein n=1 Tax=Ancylobacter sp. 3268 TaxID=2817752 RepID=UPI002864E656|nr:phage portal protein [Ancylobacter sp. 3268]MDR6952302.1 lambda family phage portal protein [Ancylobacter sp. 3268]